MEIVLFLTAFIILALIGLILTEISYRREKKILQRMYEQESKRINTLEGKIK